ncbi:MAG: helix-turn-helix transcriptional regulator [Chloroflexi bacterium]|nr:helix-turn-helix transcriptional regulator [Chloroflexota bacterium]
MTQEQQSIAAILARHQDDPELDAQIKLSELADQIIFLLEEQGLSQKSLAEKMEVSPSVVSRVLHTQENVTFLTIAKIALALGTDFAATIDRNRFPTCSWSTHSSNPEDEMLENAHPRNWVPSTTDASYGWNWSPRGGIPVATA